MKKWMVYGLIGALTAGLAMAEDTVPWYKKLFNKNADEQTQVIPPAPAAPAPAVPVPAVPAVTATPGPKHQVAGEGQRPKLTPEQMEKMKALRGAGDRQQMPLSPEKMEKMKAQHEELMRLGEAARNETDPAKKEELVGQLRAKLTEIADKMQAEAKKRLEQAEKEMPKLRERLADAEKNKSARIEEQLQRILAGQPLEMPGKRPELGGGKYKKNPKPAAAE